MLGDLVATPLCDLIKFGNLSLGLIAAAAEVKGAGECGQRRGRGVRGGAGSERGTRKGF